MAAELRFHGRGLSPGIGKGRAAHYPTAPAVTASDEQISVHESDRELRRFEAAVDSARLDLERVRIRVQADVGVEEAEIFSAHEILLADPAFLERVRERVSRDRVVAERAVQAEVEEAAKRLAATDDPYLRERSVDVRDVGRRLLSSLSPRNSDSIAPLPPGTVLVAVELLPSDTVDLDRAHVAGIVTEVGGETSHVAILARALGIPAVTGVPDAMRAIPSGEWVVVDGDLGDVTVSPTERHWQNYEIRSKNWKIRSAVEASSEITDCRTRDGQRIELCANLGRAEEAREVRRHNLDGVGLFRTEFLFLDSREPPSFERQVSAYLDVVRALDGLPLAIRTLDLGGDKIPLFMAPHAERNPSLGLRGLRFSLRECRLFETQLRALAYAAASGPVRVLFPMVLGDADLKEAKTRLQAAAGAIGSGIEIGAMIETPSAVFLIDEILEEVDFVSLGTNDLTQFVLAADRDAVGLLDGYSLLHPSVLRAIARVVGAARDRGRRVSVCGEAAGDPATAALLVGLGLRELSMSPARAARVRRAIACIDCRDAEALASEVLACRTSRDATDRLTRFASENLDLFHAGQ